MNYIDCIKQQLKLYISFILTSVITYGIMCYFGYGDRSPLAYLTTDSIVGIASGTFTFIFVYPLLHIWMYSRK